eukprot:2478790-Rhodomonas_salina.2
MGQPCGFHGVLSHSMAFHGRAVPDPTSARAQLQGTASYPGRHLLEPVPGFSEIVVTVSMASPPSQLVSAFEQYVSTGCISYWDLGIPTGSHTTPGGTGEYQGPGYYSTRTCSGTSMSERYRDPGMEPLGIPTQAQNPYPGTQARYTVLDTVSCIMRAWSGVREAKACVFHAVPSHSVAFHDDAMQMTT